MVNGNSLGGHRYCKIKGEVGMLFKHIGATFPLRLSEWILAAMLLTWGMILLRPENSFHLAHFYVYLAETASETTWGVAAVAVGLTRLLALLVNGFWVPPTFHLRSACSFISCLFWFAISYELMLSQVAAPALAMYPWLFVLEVCTLYRTARDHTNSMAAWKALRGDNGGGSRG